MSIYKQKKNAIHIMYVNVVERKIFQITEQTMRVFKRHVARKSTTWNETKRTKRTKEEEEEKYIY